MKQNLTIEIKGLTDEGYFEGMLSPYGNVDQGGDVVERGAFTKTIQDHGTTRPLLWQHKSDVPIGQVELVDTPDGLTVKGQLLMELPEAKNAYLLMKKGIVRGLSIGYATVKDSVENGVRRLKELKLFEGSVVTFPMNPAALITAIKEAEAEQNKSESLQELRELLQREYGPCELWKSIPDEIKAGRKISAATRSVIDDAITNLNATRSAVDDAITSLNALLADEAGAKDHATTSSEEAAKQETKSEPVPDHSAISTLISEFRKEMQCRKN